MKEKIKTAETLAHRDERDWQQEQFRHEVKVAGAYLNLLAAQRLTKAWSATWNAPIPSALSLPGGR